MHTVLFLYRPLQQQSSSWTACDSDLDCDFLSTGAKSSLNNFTSPWFDMKKWLTDRVHLFHPQTDIPVDALVHQSMADRYSHCIHRINQNRRESALPVLPCMNVSHSLLSATFHVSNVKTKCVAIPQVHGAVCFKLESKGCSIWQSPNGDPSPLPLVSALFSRLNCIPSGGGTDCHGRMTVSWPASLLWSRCLRGCSGVVEACWNLPYRWGSPAVPQLILINGPLFAPEWAIIRG